MPTAFYPVFFSDLTEATTCWSPHISSTGARSEPESNLLQSNFLYGNLNLLDA